MIIWVNARPNNLSAALTEILDGKLAAFARMFFMDQLSPSKTMHSIAGAYKLLIALLENNHLIRSAEVVCSFDNNSHDNLNEKKINVDLYIQSMDGLITHSRLLLDPITNGVSITFTQISQPHHRQPPNCQRLPENKDD